MNAALLSTALAESGVTLFIRKDGRLGAAPAERLTPALAASIREHRDELLSSLRSGFNLAVESVELDDPTALPSEVRDELYDAPLWIGDRLAAFRRHEKSGCGSRNAGLDSRTYRSSCPSPPRSA